VRVDVGTFRWLQTDDGRSLLAQAAQELSAGSAGGELAVQARLREYADADRVAAALSIAELRDRGRAKLGDLAAFLFFTRDGLEQATRLPVARHRAARFVAAQVSTVLDLGCGIGGDLIALASAGLTSAGVDLDELRVEMARANLAALDLGGAVQVADATKVDHSPFDAVFADPGRRSARGRTFDVEGWTPPWSFVSGLLERDACIKVAPGIPHSLIPEGVEGEWVSVAGEVKEAALWSGRLASTRRRATVIGAAGLATLTDEDDPGAGVRDVGAFLYEPDGAVIRAGLVTAVAAGVDGGLLDDQIAYVTSDSSFHTPFARSYRVLEELPYREKQLRAALRERNVGRLTIKKRGVSIDPDALRKRLSLSGSEEATIVLTRVADRGAAYLVAPF
jgi:predicted O-methyltransferase YrrM